MFKSKKTRIAAMLLGAGIAIASAQTFAFGGACHGFGPKGGDYSQGRFAERYKQHQQRLHDALKLSPQQEAAWTKFQESRPFAQPDQRPDPAEFAKLPAPERAEKMLDAQKQHQDAMAKHVVALKEFYAQLTPEQKKTFDEQTQWGRQGGRRGPGGAPAGGPAGGQPPQK